MKILKRSSVITNSIVFCFFSLAYIHLVNSFHKGVSALIVKDLLSFLGQEKILVFGMIAVVFCLYNCLKVSRIVFPIFAIVITLKSGILFFEGFDKVLLLLNFVYISCAFYFYQLIILELEEAFYNPQFTKRDLTVNGKLQNVKIITEGEKVDALVTNLDKGSLFVKTSRPVLQISQRIRIEVDYLGRSFQIIGNIMTSYAGGVGVKIENGENTSNNDLGWNELYDILKDRGIIRN